MTKENALESEKNIFFENENECLQLKIHAPQNWFQLDNFTSFIIPKLK